jgi:hypothetical protein
LRYPFDALQSSFSQTVAAALWQSSQVHRNIADPTTKRAIPSAAANPVATIVNQKLMGEVDLRKSFTRPRTTPA